MSEIIKTRKEIDSTVVGQLGLHVVSFRDMSKEKWLAKFGSVEVAEYMLDDEHGFFARMPPDVQEEARMALMGHIEQLQSGAPVQAAEPVQSTDAYQSPVQTLPHRQPPASTPVQATSWAVGITGSETLSTDKGTMYSLEALKAKLSSKFTCSDETKELYWLKALYSAKLDADLDYVTEAKKKAVSKAYTELMMEIVE